MRAQVVITPGDCHCADPRWRELETIDKRGRVRFVDWCERCGRASDPYSNTSKEA